MIVKKTQNDVKDLQETIKIPCHLKIQYNHFQKKGNCFARFCFLEEEVQLLAKKCKYFIRSNVQLKRKENEP